MSLQLKDVQEALVESIQHANDLANLTAQERYDKLLKKHPTWGLPLKVGYLICSTTKRIISCNWP